MSGASGAFASGPSDLDMSNALSNGLGDVGTGLVFVLDDPDDDESSDPGNITEIDEVEHISSVA